MPFVVADRQSAVGDGILQGIQVQGTAPVGGGREGLPVGGKHLRIEGDAHSPGGQSQHRLNIFQLQQHMGRNLGFLKQLVRDGPDPVSLFQQDKGAVLKQSQIRVLLQPGMHFCGLSAEHVFQDGIGDH